MDRSQRRAWARPLLATVLALTLTACGSGGQGGQPEAEPSASALPESTAVSVIGLPEGTEATVEDTSGASGDGENLDFVSPLYTIGPSGELDNPVTVRLELDNALPESATVLVASRDSEDEPWSYTRGYLTTDQRHAQFTTSTLNQVGVLSMDVPGALDSLQADVRSGLSAGAGSTVERPDCQGASAARQDEYSVTASKRATLHWCFGLEDGSRVVRLTNRRRVPVQVTHPGVPVVAAPRTLPAWAPWVAPLGLLSTLLQPGQTVTYDADLEPRSQLVLTATSGPTAQSLRLLQATVRALVLRLDAFGVEAGDTAATLTAMLRLRSCQRALSRGGTALVSGCLGQTQLAKLFESQQLLVAPLVTDPAFGPFLREQATAVARTVRSEEVQRVVVRRAAPAFDAFTGSWSGAGRSLVISATGEVTESFYSAGTLVISLRYQLADPTEGAAASADSVITQVRVGDRKLLTGRVPQVGDKGVLRVSDGVVTPPYLRTSYCSPAKRKACAG